MCKDQNLVSKQADSGSLSDRIAVSSEFQSTLVWTKKLFRPTVLQMLYQNTDQERDEIMNAKLDILKKENVDESDILKIFNYPAIYRKLLERDYKAMMKSFNDLFVRFPEFLPLSDQIKAKILSDAFESYVSNFINLNHKRDNTSGRIQSCSSVHGQCLNSAMMGFYVGMGLCVAGAAAGIGAAIFTGNLFFGFGGFAFGEGCAIYVNATQTKALRALKNLLQT